MDDALLEKMRFKTYCWSIGTTSFRMKYFNLMIEEQLKLLKEFFLIEKNVGESWSNTELQERYYDFLKEKNFLSGEADNKSKDARQKTSGLVDIGLINSNRRLTEVGEKLLEISLSGDFKGKDNNFFGIDRDSYIYMLQLLKFTTKDNIKPFVVLLKVLFELESITEYEFKYVLPLVVDVKSARFIVDNIKEMRAGYLRVDDIIINMIWSMDNYKSAYEFFIKNDPTEETFMLINMNRKSPQYEKPYAKLYELLVEVYVNKDDTKLVELLNATNKISGKAKGYWKKLLFKTGDKRKIQREGKRYLNENILSNLNETYEVKKYIFETIHLFKWKSTLDDYGDLNRRYINLSDLIIFDDGKIECSFLAKQYFKDIIDRLFEDSFKQSTNLEQFVTIEDILGENTPNMESVRSNIAAHFDEEFISHKDVYDYVREERLKKFNTLIDNKFTDEKLLNLLTCFERRDDEQLSSYITDNANPPTMFEYILGIIWYKLSERKGNILEFMNLSLDANFLPKSHAGGGEADIVYKYDEDTEYPQHELLLEATLADNSNQRRMEMEPVSRHLLKNLTTTKNINNYALLVSTYIHPSVISDFRGRARTEQTLDNDNYYDGIKLLAIDTQIVKNLLLTKKNYKNVYNIFETAYKSEVSMKDGWYEKEIVQKCKN